MKLADEAVKTERLRYTLKQYGIWAGTHEVRPGSGLPALKKQSGKTAAL